MVISKILISKIPSASVLTAVNETQDSNSKTGCFGSNFESIKNHVISAHMHSLTHIHTHTHTHTL